MTISMAGLKFKHCSLSMGSNKYQGTVASKVDFSQQWPQINKNHFTELPKNIIPKRKNTIWYK